LNKTLSVGKIVKEIHKIIEMQCFGKKEENVENSRRQQGKGKWKTGKHTEKCVGNC